MERTEAKTPAEAILRLARRIRRHALHKGHFNRLDRLRLLLLANDGISLRDLAGLLDMRPPSVSEWLDKLVANAELTKTPATEDKRMVHLSLTEKGKELAVAAQEKAKEPVDIFAGCLEEEEQAVFNELCRRLYLHLAGQGCPSRRQRRQVEEEGPDG